MIKRIFLDLDDTILDFQQGERRALKRTFDILNISADPSIIERYMEINLECWRGLEQGELTRDQVLIGRFERLFSEKKIDVSADIAQEIYEDLLSKEHDFVVGAEKMLKQLSSGGKYDLYIVTNGIPQVQKPRIRDSGIAKYFKGIFISEEVGYAKPDARFFTECFKRIDNFIPEETIIVGDSLSSDIQGGKNAGIKSCHFNRYNTKYKEIIPDYPISDLSQLKGLIESI